MISINIATDGLIDNINSLTIATRGLIQPEFVEDVKVVVIPERVSGGAKSPTVYVRKQIERLEPKYDIHRDDQEILEIIIASIIEGIVD